MTDISKLRSLFGSYANAQNYASAFSDMLDLFMLPFKVFDTAEERQAQLQAVTDHPQKEEVVSFLTELGECAEGFHDPLGELYMQELSRGHNGQYFTPEHICDLMAMFTIGSAENGKTVLDPACGSGRMLLAAAKINRNQVFYGADVDAVCCKMAVANMLLQSLTGEITHMNSLTNEFFTGYRISTMLYNGYHHPWFREFSNPEESRIWLRPVHKDKQSFSEHTTVFQTGNFQQGTLF